MACTWQEMPQYLDNVSIFLRTLREIIKLCPNSDALFALVWIILT
jgi:hypothetical protein